MLWGPSGGLEWPSKILIATKSTPKKKRNSGPLDWRARPPAVFSHALPAPVAQQEAQVPELQGAAAAPAAGAAAGAGGMVLA